MLIRPSLKFIKFSYVFALLISVALGVYAGMDPAHRDIATWGFIVPALIIFFTLFRHMQRRLEKITLTGDRLKYEAGLFSKSTRTVELEKVQDVRVEQTMTQRMFSIGDLSLETAGGTSRIAMASIDNPQDVADHILELARQQRTQPPPSASPQQGGATAR